jgi:hypothetical protein
MADSIQHFLLIYDHAAGRLLDVEEFGTEAKKALSRYEQLEQLHRDERQMDIVLVGSDSLDTVKVTHANYFGKGSLDQIEEFLRKVAEPQYDPAAANPGRSSQMQRTPKGSSGLLRQRVRFSPRSQSARSPRGEYPRPARRPTEDQHRF